MTVANNIERDRQVPGDLTLWSSQVRTQNFHVQGTLEILNLQSLSDTTANGFTLRIGKPDEAWLYSTQSCSLTNCLVEGPISINNRQNEGLLYLLGVSAKTLLIQSDRTTPLISLCDVFASSEITIDGGWELRLEGACFTRTLTVKNIDDVHSRAPSPPAEVLNFAPEGHRRDATLRFIASPDILNIRPQNVEPTRKRDLNISLHLSLPKEINFLRPMFEPPTQEELLRVHLQAAPNLNLRLERMSIAPYLEVKLIDNDSWEVECLEVGKGSSLIGPKPKTGVVVRRKATFGKGSAFSGNHLELLPGVVAELDNSTLWGSKITIRRGSRLLTSGASRIVNCEIRVLEGGLFKPSPETYLENVVFS